MKVGKLTFAALAGILMVLVLSANTARADGPDWALNGNYTISFTCTAGCGGTWVHAITGAATDSGGAVNATGHFIADPAYTWNMTGAIGGSTIALHILYTGTSAGYTADLTGSVSDGGIASGTATDSLSRTFTWTIAEPLLRVGVILNVTYKVTGDEDSGNVGYWALDNYKKRVKVWQRTDGSFYAVVGYEGSWTTFAGALSPGAGITQQHGGSGSMHGGYNATFTGTFAPGTQKTSGNIGTFGCGGTEADILLGTYGAGQTGPSTCFGVFSAYFPGYSAFTFGDWGWTYRYRNQTWVNSSVAITGDIVIASNGHDDEHGHDDD